MRSKDRLAELRHLANGASSAVYQDTVQPDTKLSSPHHQEIQEIIHEVERTRGWIHEVQLHTQLIRRLHSHPTFHNDAQMQEQLENAACAAQGAALKVSGALRQLGARASGGAARSDVAARIARLQYGATRTLYALALDDHHAALDALRDQRLQLLQQQIKLTNLSLSDEECCALLDEGQVSLFVENVRAETAEAKRVLRDVEVRRDALRRAETSLRELHELFGQLAQLVTAQQDQIDSVQYYALQASSHVGAGQDHLLKGTVTRTKARKKKMGLVLCVAVGVAVVLLVLVVT